jgi:hypothetical protein
MFTTTSTPLREPRNANKVAVHKAEMTRRIHQASLLSGYERRPGSVRSKTGCKLRDALAVN